MVGLVSLWNLPTKRLDPSKEVATHIGWRTWERFIFLFWHTHTHTPWRQVGGFEIREISGDKACCEGAR